MAWCCSTSQGKFFVQRFCGMTREPGLNAIIDTDLSTYVPGSAYGNDDVDGRGDNIGMKE